MIAPADLERLLLVMSKHNVTHLEAGDGVIIDRTLPPAPVAKAERRESPLERLNRLSQEDRDRELRLSALGMPPLAGRTQ